MSDLDPFRAFFKFSENAIQPRKTVLFSSQKDAKFLAPAASTFTGLKFNFRPFFIGFSKNEFVKP